MQAIDILVQEHDVIEKALALLQHVTGRIRAGGNIPDGFAVWMIQFIREFADGRHHHKEEEELFPLMEQRGVPKEHGPLGCMLHEHELGRDLTRAMEAAANAGDAARFAQAADEYTVLLREHIFKENFVLFRIAERCLAADDDARLAERFRAADLAATKSQDLNQRLAEIDGWNARLGAPIAGAGGGTEQPVSPVLPVVK